MALSNEKMRGYMQRILLSRMRILNKNGFYGLLLMHMPFFIDEEMDTAATDGKGIIFGPEFLDNISDSELDFILMHEVMHCCLQHSLRKGKMDDVMYNLACDMVVNSNILKSNGMDLSSITVKGCGNPIHALPDGTEGYELSAEEAYVQLNQYESMRKLCEKIKEQRKLAAGYLGQGGRSKSKQEMEGDNKCKTTPKEISGIWDNHTKWGYYEDDDTLRDVWVEQFKAAWNSISVRDPSNQRGLIPAFAQRMYKELSKPVVDWRTLLTNFVQENVKDYSFNPPDRRFSESPFFLPDFNDCDTADTVKNVLFMIDTSGSVSDKDMTRAYSEIKGAIDQFDGKLTGKLGFFDAAIIEPKPFCDEGELAEIKPAGGGGTDFQIIFEYVNKYMQDDPPSNIVILTDGCAPFPKEHLANGIPVMWLINNDTVEPPWGKVARITEPL